jgi:hypothetical protein
MEIINIKGTDDTPTIVFDSANNIHSISGRSLPEDVSTFYQPVLDWLEEFAKQTKPSMTLEFKLEYFNTASSKLLLDILLKLEEISEEGASIDVKWFYAKNDDDMQEAGEEYSDLVSIKFDLIPY